MKMYSKRSTLLGSLAVALSATACNPALAQSLPLIPTPQTVSLSSGTLTVADGAVIGYPANDKEAQFAANHLVDLLARTAKLKLRTQAGEKRGSTPLIRFERTRDEASADAGGRERYSLDVSTQGIKISASTDAGLYYGSITLWQLMTTSQKAGPIRLQCITIHDAPQLAWRGIMLDSARHMQSIEYIQQLIDWMSLEKLNTLHWHLTDDQGWRLEIKRYPRLTSVGGFRHLPAIFKEGGPADLADGEPYGGFYTQQQVRALVAYAAQRGVTIVPEIEMPGHASAPLAAYPEFGSSPDHLTEPVKQYGIFPYLYNVNDETFTFLENVLTEVMDLFPSPYIHVGGDEAIKDQWKSSPVIQAQMKALGIKDEDALQSYFIKRIDTFLTAHHRRTIGWDEILDGGLAPNAAVMSWHGVAGGISAAKQGHDAVLTPARPLYFNYRQTPLAAEAPGRFALNTLQDVYRFDPLPDTLTPDERKHIIGVQANLWSEYVITPDRVTWMLYPRTAALAEMGWAPAKPRDWNEFATRMTVEMQRYDKLGIAYDPNVFRVQSQVADAGTDRLTVSLSNQAEFGTIHYTLDGSTVLPSSPTYTAPLSVAPSTHVRAATFANGEISKTSLDETLNWNTLHHRFSQDFLYARTIRPLRWSKTLRLRIGP